MSIEKKDHKIIIAITLLFLLVAIPGIDWGAPGLWNPDELIRRIDFSNIDQPQFNQSDLTYPALPLFLMTIIGNIITFLGKGQYSIMVGVRLISVFLGLLIILSTYLLITRMTSNRKIGILSSIFILTNNIFLINSRYAHNDIYMMFFAVLSIYSLIYFYFSKKKFWLFVSFFLVGLAAGSKYNAGSLIIDPLFILWFFTISPGNRLSKIYQSALGSILAFLGYLVGNPFLLKDPIHYVETLLVELRLHATYDIRPGDQTGLFGQFSIFSRDIFGNILFFIICIATIYILARLILHKKNIRAWQEEKYNIFLIIFIGIFAYDIPIMFSFNYPSRFFLFLIPLLSIIFAVFIEEILDFFKNSKWKSSFVIIILTGVFIFSGLSTITVVLTYLNDSRIPASKYIHQLSSSFVLEYTNYPPTMDKHRFLHTEIYPITFIKYPEDAIRFQEENINIGEVGIEDRKPDILVVDSFTYARLSDEYICNLHEAECQFFSDLFEGKTNYQLIASFIYDTPTYLPKVQVTFGNPDIQIFQRISEETKN